MYTLRIIDQTKVGSETRRNIPVTGEYSVLMKVPINEVCADYKEGDNHFINALNNCDLIDDNYKYHVVGFVYANEATYPIYDWNVIYIVGNEGQTIERVYGLYNKY